MASTIVNITALYVSKLKLFGMDMFPKAFIASIGTSPVSCCFKSPSLGTQELKITKKIARMYQLKDFILEGSMYYLNGFKDAHIICAFLK